MIGRRLVLVKNAPWRPPGPAVQSRSMSRGHPQADAPTWTTRKLLDAAAAHLEKKDVDSPRLCAELLMAHVLEVPRIQLYADLDRPASELERAAYRTWIERAAGHEPVQYLLEEAHFFSDVFRVGPDVLIPRPSTETLVEHVIQHTRLTPGFANPTIADIGTGSGCIAIAIAKHLPTAHLIATDVSEAALKVARANAETHQVADRIEFRHGPCYEPLHGERLAYIVSNPPYIPDAEWQQVAPNVKDHEPVGALRGGSDGLDVLRPLIAEAAGHLAQPGQIVFEIAASQKAAVIEEAGRAAGLGAPRVLADHDGLPRMLVADHA